MRRLLSASVTARGARGARAALLALACAAVGAAAAACRESPTTPAVPAEPPDGPSLADGQRASTERWLELTRAILGRREVGGPTRPTRILALVAVAQYNATVAAATAEVARGAARPSESAAAAAASAGVLRALYPAEADSVAALAADDRAYLARFETPRGFDVAAGAALGERAAAAVLARAATDRSDLVFAGPAPNGPGIFVGAPGVPAFAPRWGEVRGWALARGDQLRPAAPPAFGSAEYRAQLAAVRAATDARTPEQLRVAQFWQTGVGPGGPPGFMASRAIAFARGARYTERQTARLLALTTMAMMDATVACWDAKYAWWYLRPHEGDPAITTPVGRPNFPSYPSAHSCVTASAAGVLARAVPDSAAALDALVAETGQARIWAGLHFPLDVTAGAGIGRAAAALVLARAPGARGAIPLE